MNDKKNFILGDGEKLTTPVHISKNPGIKKHPYTFEESLNRLTPRIQKTIEEIDKLPDIVCPDNKAIAILTLHPAYIAKSYFPERLLVEANFQAIGSRSNKINPVKTVIKKKKTELFETVDIFISGKRNDFKNWRDTIEHLNPKLKEEFIRIEDIRTFYDGERLLNILNIPSDQENTQMTFEIVLHIGESNSDFDTIIRGFNNYIKKLDLHGIDFEKIFRVKGLCFIQGRLSPYNVKKIENFSFLRLVRKMPELRCTKIRSPEKEFISTNLPNCDPIGYPPQNC